MRVRPNENLADGSPAYTAPAAAKLLGLDERTVRSRVERGVLRGERRPSAGKKLYYLVDAREIDRELPAEPLAEQRPASAAVADDDLAMTLEMIQLRSDLTERRAALAASAAHLEAEQAVNAMLRRRIDELEERIEQLSTALAHAAETIVALSGRAKPPPLTR